MAPLRNVTNKKLASTTSTSNKDNKSTTIRKKAPQIFLKGENDQDLFFKRKADASPLFKKTTKRSAFGDLTNAIGTTTSNTVNGKKVVKKATTVVTKSTTTATNKPTAITTSTKPVLRPRVTRSCTVVQSNAAKSAKPAVPILPKPSVPVRKAVFVPPKAKLKVPENVEIQAGKKPVEISQKSYSRLSSELEKTDGSLYVSALDEILDESTNNSLPEPEDNIDKENWCDPYQVSMYAHEIFTYLKSRETHYVIKDYMPNQKGITSWMRALLVDWLVEVQENFELNHETLYLAVKLVDMYLGKVQVNKATLQLVGAASMLIAAKYDERIPPIIDDFIHVCDGAYTRRDMTRMEVQILKTIDFNLGIPLSYRFLRRYARCAKIQMPLLTLARFILEYSLMEYPTITLSDSKMAAASLYLALKMKKCGSWTNTLHYFSGYKVEDFKEVAILLNSILHKPPKDLLSTVRSKYSHKIFFEVAKTPLLDDCEL